MKKLFTVILWLLVIANMSTIYYFSDQPAKKSSSVSNSVTKKITKPMTKNKSAKEKKKIEEKWNNRIRTIAHFSSFFLLGLFVMGALLMSFEGKKSFVWTFILTMIICLIYSLLDEYHQTFIPGRTAQLIDIIVDCSGSLLSCSIIALIRFIKKKRGTSEAIS